MVYLSKNNGLKLAIAISSLALGSCASYKFSSDPYLAGLQAQERGDCDRAVNSIEPLAEKGDCDAEYKLALMYFLGSCKAQNNKKALEYFHRAASKGQPKSEVVLGNLYYQNMKIAGISSCPDCKIKKDLVEAMKWYLLARENTILDHERSFVAEVTSQLEKEMKDKDRKIAERLAERFEYKPEKCVPRKDTSQMVSFARENNRQM